MTKRTHRSLLSRVTFLGLLAFFLILPICAVNAETPLKPISFIPQWSPQAQFAGYYVAYEMGIYKKYGLDVRIIQGGAHRHPSEMLERGEADIASIWLSTSIQKRSHGMKLVNIAQIVERSSLMLVAKKSRGIKKPEDLNGRKVGLWGNDFRIQPEAFFRKYKITVNVVPQSYSVNLFLRDGVDAASAMWYNEYHTILNAGINADELTTFSYGDHGLNFPEDGLYVMEERIKKDPESVCNFVRASIEGWKYSFDHPDKAIEIILKYMTEAKVPANKMHQKWMLDRMRDLVMLPGVAPGTLIKEDYDRVGRELKQSGLIKEIPDMRSFSFACRENVQR